MIEDQWGQSRYVLEADGMSFLPELIERRIHIERVPLSQVMAARLQPMSYFYTHLGYTRRWVFAR